jgi:hypothetical protein
MMTFIRITPINEGRGAQFTVASPEAHRHFAAQ